MKLKKFAKELENLIDKAAKVKNMPLADKAGNPLKEGSADNRKIQDAVTKLVQANSILNDALDTRRVLKKAKKAAKKAA